MTSIPSTTAQNTDFFNTVQENAHSSGVDDGDDKSVSREEFIAGAGAMGVSEKDAGAIFDSNLAWVNQHGGGDGNDTLSLSEIDTTDIRNQTEEKGTFTSILDKVKVLDAFLIGPSDKHEQMNHLMEEQGGA